ncbi:RND efflux system, outer membrane lipoprotein CmeC [Candidatus Burkholderia humilis]|nr:RND efflux system, outer membrane lipoprotein CmeC [Candidatus Burkholderia humilis]
MASTNIGWPCLTGRAPEALIAELDGPAPLPVLAVDLDPGTPGDLLRRRPDVAAAEARLHAATARVGIATVDLYPRFTLSDLLGSMSASYGVFRSGSETNLIALGIDWSFLHVGRVRARIAASNADAAGQLAQYRQTVLLALEDTENALLHVSRTRDESAHLDRAADQSAQAARLAQARFKAGAVDYYEVLDAQRTLLQAQDAAEDARMRRATASVSLFQGAGWRMAKGCARNARGTGLDNVGNEWRLCFVKLALQAVSEISGQAAIEVFFPWLSYLSQDF